VIRVLVADDSATARALLRAILEAEGDMRVVAEARDGAEAVSLVKQHQPDLVIMDVHMPVADGIAATKQIMMELPTPIVIVSAVSQRDVDLSLSATQAGALMALPKPGTPGSARFEEEAAGIRSMARAMSQVKVVRYWSATAGSARELGSRRGTREPAALVAMAASTGGPAALRRVLMDLPRTFPVPIVLVQHIARDFAAGFAEWLGTSCALPVKVAEHGEAMQPGVVYVAPDDRHLGVTRGGRVRLGNKPPVSGFRPSATYLFESAAREYGPGLVAVILTGMGSDGADGLLAAHAAGAYVIAQDETTSIVYGMAQEAVRRGAVDAIVPLAQIAPRLVDAVARETDAG
jgi:two-component system, chemotaxis family, protein-glutamate methylesterase/glutaminase